MSGNKMLSKVGPALLAMFYLASVFFVPVLAIEIKWSSKIIEAILVTESLLVCIHLWGVVTKLALVATSELYGFNNVTLFKRFTIKIKIRRQRSNRMVQKTMTLILIFVSYFLAMYMYAIVYGVLSKAEFNQFTQGNLSFISSLYFSFTTITSIGSSEISPTTDFAKLLLMTQYSLGFVYAIFVVAELTGYLKSKGQ